MRFLCRIGWHKWSKWEDIMITWQSRSDPSKTWKVPSQIITCQYCGKKHTRDV